MTAPPAATHGGHGGLVLRDGEVEGRRVDVRVVGGLVAALGDARTLVPGRHDEVLDLDGGAVLSGLHDHHIHLLALAAARTSIRVGPPDVTGERGLVAALREADAHLPTGAWVRAVGYHDSVAGPLDRWRLDAIVPGRPVRVQHRSGALWILSSAGARTARLDEAGGVEGVERSADGVPTGRLWRLDAWLRHRLPVASPPDLATVGSLLLRRGVTGVTDATPTEDPTEIALLAGAVNQGHLPQRVVVTGGPCLDLASAGLTPPRDPPGAGTGGGPPPAAGRQSPSPAAGPRPGPLVLGPVKLLLPDPELPLLDRVVADLRRARAQGRAAAVHSVTRDTLALTLAALDEVGAVPGDRIEHGAVVGLDAAVRLAELGLTVVTNPGFVAERGDRYQAEVEPEDLPDLWRARSLLDRGVAVGAGTDAPFAQPDPWAVIAAAADRRMPTGAPLGPGEAVPATRALQMFLTPPERPGGAPRRVVPGAAADLCILRTPLADALRDPRSTEVAGVVIGGTLHPV